MGYFWTTFRLLTCFFSYVKYTCFLFRSLQTIGLNSFRYIFYKGVECWFSHSKLYPSCSLFCNLFSRFIIVLDLEFKIKIRIRTRAGEPVYLLAAPAPCFFSSGSGSSFFFQAAPALFFKRLRLTLFSLFRVKKWEQSDYANFLGLKSRAKEPVHFWRLRLRLPSHGCNN